MDGAWKNEMPINDMTLRIGFGSYWSRICLVGKEFGEVERRITEGLSMRYSGSCARVLLGEIYHRSTEAGAIHTDDLSDGEIRESGNTSLRNLLMPPITSGS